MGYGSHENSWEPAQGVARCTRLLAGFWEHIGSDVGCRPGTVIEASEAWITQTAKKERDIAAEEEAKEKAKEIKKKERRMEKTGMKRNFNLSAPGNFMKRKIMSEDESSDDDLPLVIQLPLLKKRRLESLDRASTDVTDNVETRETSMAVDDLPSSPSASQSAQASPVPESICTDIEALSLVNIDPKKLMLSDDAPSGSGISTKNRLSQLALSEAVPPKAISSVSKRRKPVPLPPLRNSATSSLMALNFKKKTAPTPVIPPGSSHSLVAEDSIASPIQMPVWSQLNMDPFSEEQDVMANVADMFLFEEPLPEEPETQRNWTWSGEVFTKNDQSKAAFSVTFCDVTTSVSGGLAFEAVLPVTTNRLDFPAFHNAVDLNLILSTCRGVHQWARLEAKENPDVEILASFGAYMAKMQMIVWLPMSIANTVVGHLVIFCYSTHSDLVASQLKPPPEVQKAGSLIAALLPLTSLKLPTNKDQNLTKLAVIESFIKNEAEWVETLRRKPLYHHGLRGIVTFTALALIDDLIGVLHWIKQIHGHPLWACYILPSVLGMAAKVNAQREGSDPMADFDRGKSPYRRVLVAIDEGDISLVSSPPACKTTTKQEWLDKYWIYRPSGPRAILQASVDAFTSAYNNLRPKECETAILDEISRDLRGMRSYPAFMKERRRFVVIDSPKLEWTSTTRFEFKDNFFEPSQQ
ncbi:hypothetical protein H0H92_000130 [Tricholoma furcatifolium]|nr:hypothetical protein H0H92_000130 [Tricholoma furcatifolium]